MTGPDTSNDELQEQSQFAHLLDEMQLFGYRPHQDDPDHRPLPEAPRVQANMVDVFDALVSTFADTRLEDDAEDVLWGVVNVFHRAIGRIERELDDNEQAQKREQREFDGSEVKSVELERHIAEGISLLERRNAFEFIAETSRDLFETHTRSKWQPRYGSLVNRRTMTAAMIDSRDFIAARRRAETELHMPTGPKIAFTGGKDFEDHRLVWQALDRVHAKHPGMVLLHGGTPTGADLIAAKWAEARKVVPIAFRPDWAKHAKAAPFKRNDQMLDVLPIGVIVFPGGGISDNLADKARKLGIPLFDFRKSGA
jgi:hypothetical protein